MSKNKIVKPEDTYLSDDDGIPHIDYVILILVFIHPD